MTRVSSPAATDNVLMLRNMVFERADRDRRFRLETPEFLLRRGETLALCGENGSGKSTLIEILALARAPASVEAFDLLAAHDAPGDVKQAWTQAADSLLTRWRARHFGYIQQTGGLLGFLTVGENLALSQTLSGRRDPARIRDLAGKLEITSLLKAYPAALSVGQRQRAVIARALAHDPPIILADEPTASLDVAAAEGLVAMLCEIARANGIALIMATHNRALAESHGFTPVMARLTAQPDGQITRFAHPAAVA